MILHLGVWIMNFCWGFLPFFHQPATGKKLTHMCLILIGKVTSWNIPHGILSQILNEYGLVHLPTLLLVQVVNVEKKWVHPPPCNSAKQQSVLNFYEGANSNLRELHWHPGWVVYPNKFQGSLHDRTNALLYVEIRCDPDPKKVFQTNFLEKSSPDHILPKNGGEIYTIHISIHGHYIYNIYGGDIYHTPYISIFSLRWWYIHRAFGFWVMKLNPPLQIRSKKPGLGLQRNQEFQAFDLGYEPGALTFSEKRVIVEKCGVKIGRALGGSSHDCWKPWLVFIP